MTDPQFMGNSSACCKSLTRNHIDRLNRGETLPIHPMFANGDDTYRVAREGDGFVMKPYNYDGSIDGYKVHLVAESYEALEEDVRTPQRERHRAP